MYLHSHPPPPPLTFILPVWWALVCCFTDAALTSDSNLFITSVYTSSFLSFPPIHWLARRSLKSLQSGWSNIDITLCNNTGHPLWPQPAILAIASPHKDRRWAEYDVGFILERWRWTMPFIYSCSFFSATLYSALLCCSSSSSNEIWIISEWLIMFTVALKIMDR